MHESIPGGGYTMPAPVPQRVATTLRTAIAASFLICSLALAAQEKGAWRAASSNARSITGDVALSDEKIAINFSPFTMVRVRALEKSELSAAFDADPNTSGGGSVYRLNIPA